MNGIATALGDRLERQLAALFPPLSPQPRIGAETLERAIERTNTNVRRLIGRADTDFRYLVSGEFATFLYYLSKLLTDDPEQLENATRLFLLNKALNGIDLFHEVEMPDYFLIGHTVGMVFAKATYGDYCIFHQGCTVGRSGIDRPTLGRGVILYPNASVIGRCEIGDNTVLTPGVQMVNRDSPGNCLVFQTGGTLQFKPIDKPYAANYYAL